MRAILSALAVAALLSAGMGSRCAEAMTPAAAHPFAPASIVRNVVNLCGSRGCMPVQTKRVQHRKPGAVAAKHI